MRYNRCGPRRIAALPAGDGRRFAGRVQLVGRQGLSVISDVDDTVKDSNVLDLGAYAPGEDNAIAFPEPSFLSMPARIA